VSSTSRVGPVSRDGLRSLLAPRSIALIGVSDDPASIGGAPLANLDRFGYDGDIHLVSRSRRAVGERPVLSQVADLAPGVDVAILAVPAAAATSVLADCGRRGVRGAVVFSSGFAEVGEQGAQAQAGLVAVAREYGMALAGPNCLGLVNFAAGVPLTFSMVEPDEPAGRPAVGLVAQSGAMTVGLTYAAQAAGLAVSCAVSTGNEAVLGLEDYFEYLIDDDATQVIGLLAEQIRGPRRFRALAARARAAGKPVVLLHLGRSERGRRSAATHTGALSGDYDVIEAVLTAEGIALVDGLDELIDVAHLLAHCPAPSTPAAAIVTDSGAIKTFCADRAETEQLELAELDPATVTRLRDGLPAFATATNPADLTAQGLNDSGIYTRGIAAMLDDPAVGMLLIATMIGSPTQTAEQADAVLRGVQDHEGPGKPVCYALLGGNREAPPDVLRQIQDRGILLLRSPERALAALRRVAQRTVALADAARIGPGVAALAAPPQPETLVLTEYESKQYLGQHGLAMLPGELAHDAAAAAGLAGRTGYPVAVKAQAAGLVHKSEAGAVALGLESADQVTGAVENMTARLTDWPVDGFLVEPMAPPGVELIIGAHRDPEWGATILAGLGGVAAEALRDVVLLPGRFDAAMAVHALESLRGAKLLGEFRGAPARDVPAAADLLVRLAEIMAAHPDVQSVDMNPVLILPKGEGALALDATVVRTRALPPP
jgi:acyl-CoA synthetase (NDP forming)